MTESDVASLQALRAKFVAAREAAPAREVRAAALAYYRARAAEGATQAEVAGELGLTRWTLSKWHQRREVDDGRGAEGEQKQAPSEAAVAECIALKQEIERLGPRGPSRRFPEDLKQRVARWVRSELDRGVGAAAAAEQVGIPWESISRWIGRRPQLDRPPKLRPVRVVESARAVVSGAAGPILKSPNGFIVEGLDVPSLVEMLRYLG